MAQDAEQRIYTDVAVGNAPDIRFKAWLVHILRVWPLHTMNGSTPIASSSLALLGNCISDIV